MKKIIKSKVELPKSRKKLFIISGIILVLILIALSAYYFNFYDKQDNFSVNTILLKSNIQLGSELSQTIQITNDYSKKQDFSVYFEGLDEIANLNETEFSIDSGESKNIFIYFKDIKNQINVYSGNLIIKNSKSKKEIPVIIAVEDSKKSFAITQKILNNPDEIYVKDNLKLDLKIFDLVGKELKNVKATYIIKDFNSGVLFSEDEDLAVKESVSLTKTFNFPANIKPDKYVFVTIISSENSKSITSTYFEISRKKFGMSFNSIEFLALILLIFVFGTLILFFKFLKGQEGLSHLRTQQKDEIRNTVEAFNHYKKILEEEKEEIRKRYQDKLKEVEESKKKRNPVLSLLRSGFKGLKITTEKGVDGTLNLLKGGVKSLRTGVRTSVRTIKETKKSYAEIKHKYELREKEEVISEYENKFKKLEEEKKKLVENLKFKHEKQVKEVIELKKEKKPEKIKEKIKEWKQEAKEMKEFKQVIKKIPQPMIKKNLEKEEKNLKKEFMGKFYSNLGKKDLKLK